MPAVLLPGLPSKFLKLWCGCCIVPCSASLRLLTEEQPPDDEAPSLPRRVLAVNGEVAPRRYPNLKNLMLQFVDSTKCLPFSLLAAGRYTPQSNAREHSRDSRLSGAPELEPLGPPMQVTLVLNSPRPDEFNPYS